MIENLFFEANVNNIFSYYFTDFIAIASISSAILVIITKNPVISVIYLILLFILVGVYLILLNMTFIGLSYLLVYIGAIAILFLFIIMLLDIKSSELININNNSKLLGIILTILSINFIYYIIPRSFQTINSLLITKGNNIDSTMYNLYNISWESMYNNISHLSIIGNLMYNYYMIWLFITAFILLVSLIGAILLIKKTE